MKVKIEKNIPIPEKQSGRSNKGRGQYEGMEVGDSFVYRGKNPAGAPSGAKMHFKRLGIPAKFAQRTMENGDVRVWRVE